ncbi:MAG: hypothetical protein OEX19_01260, partial [Gammaproteobacteria bacterium]|nr:hypothetical protein [Gammaproteobacteria bacterium]
MDIFSMDRFGRSIINADESVRLPIIPIHFSPDLLKTVLPFQMLTRYSTWLIIIVFLGFIFTGCGGGITDDTEAPDSPIIA